MRWQEANGRRQRQPNPTPRPRRANPLPPPPPPACGVLCRRPSDVMQCPLRYICLSRPRLTAGARVAGPRRPPPIRPSPPPPVRLRAGAQGGGGGASAAARASLRPRPWPWPPPSGPRHRPLERGCDDVGAFGARQRGRASSPPPPTQSHGRPRDSATLRGVRAGPRRECPPPRHAGCVRGRRRGRGARSGKGWALRPPAPSLPPAREAGTQDRDGGIPHPEPKGGGGHTPIVRRQPPLLPQQLPRARARARRCRGRAHPRRSDCVSRVPTGSVPQSPAGPLLGPGGCVTGTH